MYILIVNRFKKFIEFVKKNKKNKKLGNVIGNMWLLIRLVLGKVNKDV